MKESLESIVYEAIDDKEIFHLISATRNGIKWDYFEKLKQQSPFTWEEWAEYLALSQRTLQRYKKEKVNFDRFQSERIIQIVLLYRMGERLFGSRKKFGQWMEMELLPLGREKPKDMLDTSFGIDLIRAQLIRIHQGVFV